ncbi:hypothetical protein OSH11_02475 [Kaistia dalseonensis]|uniref:Flap endonuclease-1-like 5' DNA nuclease n=1 Tax=Kaistia dalseonensis TaxID=410840 RepID=A0ABU0H2K7_9HYPH|nr:hypothetical protein [Kaistia dalseonensis]MCX5493563.1 hypothetical protein [Kaistia dalseonensis]MDQ0436123.1 putative flap endonuclease-1-like 5' DNA nuclease [Kaistia dalseonensis]
MILHAAELWAVLALCFLFGCLVGSLLNRAVALTGAAASQTRIIHGIDLVIRVLEWRILPWRNREPVPLPQVVPVPPPNFSHLPEELVVTLPPPEERLLPAELLEPVAMASEPTPLATDPAKLAEALARADGAGHRPLPLAGPRGGVADDLAAIKGLGKRHAARLASVGIFHFSQIAAWTPQEIAWVAAFLDVGDTIVSKDWVGQSTRVASADDPAEAVKPKRKLPRPRSKRGKAKKQSETIGESASADRSDEAGNP